MMPEFRFAHLGINHDNEMDAAADAGILKTMFGFPLKEGRSSIFSGVDIELMKNPFLGERGHIGIRTPDVETAVRWLAEKNVKTLAGTEKYTDNRLKAVYLDMNLSGFAVHLIRC